MTTPTENWPKPFMLQLHEQAVKDGFIWVEGISNADYESLKSRLYRIRRRSDKSMAAFIPPEYHLVMIGQWEPCGPLAEDGATLLGRFPLIYNKKADGSPLPTIRTASGEEVEAYAPKPKLAEPAEPLHFDEIDLTMKPKEIDDFVKSLQAKSKERKG